MLVLIKGAGDLATGLAVRLFNCHIPVVMTELPKPSAIRRTVCFSEAIYNGIAVVENITAVSASSLRMHWQAANGGCSSRFGRSGGRSACGRCAPPLLSTP